MLKSKCGGDYGKSVVLVISCDMLGLGIVLRRRWPECVTQASGKGVKRGVKRSTGASSPGGRNEPENVISPRAMGCHEAPCACWADDP